MTKEQRSAAARLGWERRKAKQAAEQAARQRRSEAARKGWETRRKREMAREMEKEWLKEQEAKEEQRRREEERAREEAERETAAGMYSQAEAIDDQLHAILIGGPGGENIGRALIDALNDLIDDIGEEAYYQNLVNNANLIMDRANKIVYPFETENKVVYAQAIYMAASGGKPIPDSHLTEIFAANNADRRAQYKKKNPNAKSRGPYKKKK